jgi:hypothetical protein
MRRVHIVYGGLEVGDGKCDGNTVDEVVCFT